MFICPVCKRKFEKQKSLHGHMLKDHLESYRAHGCRVGNYLPEDAETGKSNPIPEGFRLLNKSDPAERAAYERGYRFIDDSEELYTVEEVKQRGII